MNGTKLSYVMTTRNKLSYVKGALERLINNINEDEEIVVADGASTDGTKEYLAELFRQGKIHQFISEPDQSEAQGYNKCLLTAGGELLKIITDDDVFYYPAIQECKKFMLEHPEYDLLGSDGAAVHWHHPQPFQKTEYYKQYLLWKEKKIPFSFCGLGLMIRKKSLTLTGLFNPFFRNTDGEFTLRVTATPGVNMAWHTGSLWAWLMNSQSNTRLLRKRVEKEIELYHKFYSNFMPVKTVPPDKIDLFAALKIKIWRLTKRVGLHQPFPKEVIPSINAGYERSYIWLKEQQEKSPGEFLA